MCECGIFHYHGFGFKGTCFIISQMIEYEVEESCTQSIKISYLNLEIINGNFEIRFPVLENNPEDQG